MAMDAAADARSQYAGSTHNLDRRIALHEHGTTAPLTWPEFVRARLPHALRVVDVGAGTGIHWQGRWDVDAVLADLHTPMCRDLKALGRPVVQASAEQLPVASASFDGVLSTHVLYHVPHPERAIGEMVRVVRPGGWIALASNGPRHMSTLDDLRRSVGLSVDRSLHDRWGITHCVDGLRSVGLDPVRHDYDDDLQVTDAERVVDYCASLDDLSDEQAATMRATVLAEIAGKGHYRVVKETALVVASVPT